MDDNGKPHRVHIVREFRQQEEIDTFQWLPMSSDMNPIERVMDVIVRKVNQRNQECQNITELINEIMEG